LMVILPTIKPSNNQTINPISNFSNLTMSR